jgi:rhodanese-related sulfurtransferase
MTEPIEITPEQARTRLTAEPKRAVLIDVREPEELALARVAGAQLVPMQAVPGTLQQLEATADEHDLLILCHHGVRSLQVASWLRERGIENSYSVAGGIDRWSRELDPSVARY